MGFYGSAIIKNINSSEDELFEHVTNEEFLDSFYKNYYSMLNEVTFIHSMGEVIELSEDGTVTDNATEDKGNSSEKTKQSIIEKIGAMFSKFINWVKTIFQKIIDSIKQFYDKYLSTLRDKTYQALFGKLEFKDVQTAREKGWKGIPETKYAVRSANETDSIIFDRLKDLTKQDDSEKLGNMLEEMYSNQGNVAKAKEIYGRINDKLEEMQNDSKLTGEHTVDDISRYAHIKNISSIITGKSITYFYYTRKNGTEGYWYPEAKDFEGIKEMALKGQEHIKNFKNTLYKDDIEYLGKRIEQNKKEIADIKKNPSTADNGKEFDEFETMYLKACISVNSFQIKLMYGVIGEIAKFLAKQHSVAMGTYMSIFNGVRPYLKGAKAEAPQPQAATANS